MPVVHHQQFELQRSYFDHQSTLHGINHTYRVMLHVLNIGQQANLDREILPAWCAAYIHDMARKHDGYCTRHGAWSANTKLPLFRDFFAQQGVDDEGLRAIEVAVANHSAHQEIHPRHPYYKITALLKDADALDRIRISETNLKVKYLRYPVTASLVDFAKALYYATPSRELTSFDELLQIAESIGGVSFGDLIG
ncbi:MAG TPA: HD domain-containing protein [Bacteroidales bacterium]|nr:HD domain-containing protein [Bacteroidales bacterium]